MAPTVSEDAYQTTWASLRIRPLHCTVGIVLQMLCIIHFGPIGYQPTESHTTRDSDTSSWLRLGYFIDSEQLQNWAEQTSFGKTHDRTHCSAL